MNEEFAIFREYVKKQFSAYNVEDFEDISTWSSMQSLVVVSAIDEAYDVLIPYEELAKVSTLKELYHLLEKKAKE